MPAAQTSSLLSAPSEELPNFSCDALLPWYPYTQASAFRTSVAFQKFRECLVESREEDLSRARKKAKLRRKLMDDLRESYSGCDSFALGAPPPMGEEARMEDEVMEKEEDESLSHVPSVLRASSEKELIDSFWDKYGEFVSGSAEEIDVELLHKWTTSSMAMLLEAFRNLVMEDSEDLLISKFWQVLESMSRSAQLSSQESKSREATECLLQVLMDLESITLCAGSVPTEALSFIAQKVDGFPGFPLVKTKVITLLRRVTLYNGPTLPVHFMQTLVMPAYSATCRGVLMEVCDSMMYPLPPDLQSSSPSSSPGGPGEEESTDIEILPVSLEEPLAPKAIGKPKQCFVRHRSFLKQSFTRQIMIPKKKKKTSQKVVAGKKALLRLKKSPKSLMKNLPEVGRKVCHQRRRSVCRSLFSRSHTVGDIGLSRLTDTKQARSEKDSIKLKKERSKRRTSHVLAKETPLKKQVEDYHKFKLERLRSKSTCSPSVTVVEESPQRSFYSAPKRSWLTPQFKTPPLKVQTSPSLSLNKEPSPATIYSLLHDKFTPSAGQKPSLLTITQRQSHLATSSTVDSVSQPFDDILSSEDMFEAHQPELDRVVHQTRTAGFQLGFKPVRMLTYEKAELFRQSPHKMSAKNIGTPTKLFRTPIKTSTDQTKTPMKSNTTGSVGIVRTPKKTPRTPIKFNRTPLKSRRTPKWLRRKHANELQVKSYSDSCLLVDLDPSIAHDSASMVAFSLSTPTKEDPQDFHNAIQSHMTQLLPSPTL